MRESTLEEREAAISQIVRKGRLRNRPTSPCRGKKNSVQKEQKKDNTGPTYRQGKKATR